MDKKAPILTILLGEGSYARWALRLAVLHLVAHRTSRALINRLYLAFNTGARRRFYLLFAKIFRGSRIRCDPGIWKLSFNGKGFEIPLGTESMWLDWDNSLGTLGNDIDVKVSYARIINSEVRPDLFCDVGANYGTHSLLFLVQGIESLSFEPNPLCIERFQQICAQNNIRPQIEPFAIGDAEADVRFRFPKTDTWLGSVVSDESCPPNDVIEIEVKQRPLDDYYERLVGKKVLIKIDTEGYELHVLRGASRILNELRPIVIFECLKEEEQRSVALKILDSVNYSVFHLPWSGTSSSPMNAVAFKASDQTNFLALPRLQGQRG